MSWGLADPYRIACRHCVLVCAHKNLRPACLTQCALAAIELKSVFQKLQDAEQSGLSAEHVKKLEEQAAEQGVRVIWKAGSAKFACIVRG